MTKNILLICLIIFNTIAISCKKKESEPTPAKFGNLAGVITNQYGQPIDGALVEINSNTTSSGVDGKYAFTNILVNDNYPVSVSKSGYLNQVKNSKITENATSNLDFVLTAGSPYLAISDSILNINASQGSINIKISSNAGWVIKSSSTWASVTKINGNGNDVVNISYSSYTGASNRADTIQFLSGTIKKTLVITQSAQIQLTGYEGVFGNGNLTISDSVYLHFNKAVKSITITSNYTNCQSNIAYKFVDNNTGVMFSYGCGSLGGSYPFTINVTDDAGNSISKNINVNFYKYKLNVQGFVTDYLLINNEKEVLISTISPNKLIRYSIKQDSIIQTYDMSQAFYPYKLSFNPYNSKIYIMGSVSANRNNGITSPDIYTLNLQTGQVIKELTIQPDPTDAPQYPVNIPFNIGFTNSGHGIILLRSNYSSALKWKLIDCTNGYTISAYPYPISNTDALDNVQMASGQTKLILTQTYTGSCDYGVFDGNTQTMSILRPSSVTRSVFITPNRKNDKVYFGQLYDQFVMDLQKNISKISYLDNRSNGSADFSYRSNEDNIVYFCDDSYFQILNYNNSGILMYCSVISGLRKFTSTVDGTMGLAYLNGTTSSFYVFNINALYRNAR